MLFITLIRHFIMERTFIFNCPLCNSIPESEKEDFLNQVRFTIKSYKEDEWILSQGEDFTALYIIIEGKVKTVMVDDKGDFMHIENIEAPAPLASGFLFSDKSRSPISAIAEKDVKIITIPKDNVFLLMRNHEAFMHAILTSISNKLEVLSEKVRLTSLRTIRAKVAYYLLRESEGQNEFKLPTSKQEIANLFGVSRQALSNVMKELHDENKIDIDRRFIKIIDRHALRNMF